MKRTIIVAAALAVALAEPAAAHDHRDGFTTLKELFEFVDPKSSEFMLYVAGIAEGHLLATQFRRVPPLACPSPETTRKELMIAVLDWMEANLDKWQTARRGVNAPGGTARAAIMSVLIQKFPCRGTAR